jgi:hypothetical protein
VVDVYADSVRQESVIRASCDDCRAGAMEDVREQEQDQKSGRKVDGDILVLYSDKYLGGRYEVKAVWEEWMGKGELEVGGLMGEVGHFLAEEAPGQTAELIVDFYQRHE